MAIILVIEDDLKILRGLEMNLKFEGYTVLAATEGHEGLKKALEEPVDLLLLDLMLPGLSGYDICRKVRERKPDLPIVMLTAKGEEIDKVAGFDLGADDYVTKPFGVSELMARKRALKVATGSLRLLTNEGRDYSQYAYAPRWSHDSTRLAFAWQRSGGLAELRVIALDGSPSRVVLPAKEREAADPLDWSPDGNRVLAMSYAFFPKGRAPQLTLVSIGDCRQVFLHSSGGASGR